MTKLLTPEQLKLAGELKVRREELRELARIKRNQAIIALKKYSKLIAAHEHFVYEHERIDRKLFLLTPGIKMCEAYDRKMKREKKKAVKKKNSGFSIAESIGGDEMKKKLEVMIAKRKRES